MHALLRKLKRQDGFTLVELMVVVAIIGLLSAVAIPNFKKYQAKAKISEAKLQLSAAYTAEASFFSDYNMYGHCLTYMGFDPGPESANRYFAVGFATPATYNATAYAAAANSGIDTSAAGCPNTATGATGGTATTSSNDSHWFPAGKGVGSVIASTNTYLPTSTHGDQSTAATMTYTIGAGGVISQEFTATTNAAQLSINDDKVLRSVRNGF